MRRVGHKPQAPKVDEFVVFLKNQSQKFLPNGKKRVFFETCFFFKIVEMKDYIWRCALITCVHVSKPEFFLSLQKK